MDDQPGPSNIQILPQITLQPESITINTSTSGQICEPPQQSATDQGDVSQAASVTINSAQELQFTPVNMNASAVFNPEIVKPLPKASPRLQMATKRRIRKTAVLTDTPEKNALAEEQVKKKSRKEKAIRNKGKENNNNKEKGTGKGKAQKKGKRRVLQESESDSDDEVLEWYCIICCDSYSNSLPREKWIECSLCRNWAYVKCINETDNITYVCPNCESDEEFNDE
ncbi:PHD finger protein ALFIN-LIKE 3-like [Pararge aegeria]|uniref:PHD finger protein ALFIN-LIKE 3-like n=1 Tax=Pararge aegeria TaxID=116150 RepID=UPI0019D2A308|nr:PHD finger protein ALFIN-LIKE 3-like [Pararge aegeria]